MRCSAATWLIIKTEGDLQRRMIELARPLTLTCSRRSQSSASGRRLAHSAVAHRWFSFPNLIFFAPVPILVLATAWGILQALKGEQRTRRPSSSPSCFCFLGYSGLGISMWPNIIPPDVSIRAAAGPPQSLGFALVGALFIVPIILTYTAWSYYVFRGKVKSWGGLSLTMTARMPEHAGRVWLRRIGWWR